MKRKDDITLHDTKGAVKVNHDDQISKNANGNWDYYSKTPLPHAAGEYEPIPHDSSEQLPIESKRTIQSNIHITFEFDDETNDHQRVLNEGDRRALAIEDLRASYQAFDLDKR